MIHPIEPGTWDGYLRNETYEVTMANELAISDNLIRVCSDYELTEGKIQYINLPMAFDIETTSFYDDEGKKTAIMYIWQFGINGAVFYGRTWEEFNLFITNLANSLATDLKKRAIIYVYNLSFEFQFMRHYIDNQIYNIFADKKRKPIYVTLENGLEFRDAQILAGANYSLDYVSRKLLLTYPIRKLVGNLDYSLIRHSKTPMSANELAYCCNDVLVLNSYIQEKIETDGDIAQIPLTNTGYVRDYTRSITLEQSYKDAMEYRSIMSSLRINDVQEYTQFTRGFMGGYVHAAALHCTDTLDDVMGRDIKSSYPSSIVLDDFPMSPFTYIGNISEEDFFYYISTKCCLFDIKYIGLQANSLAALPISSSKSTFTGEQIFMGRIVSASTLITTCTELDFQTYSEFYDCDAFIITNFRYAEKGALPRSLIQAVLALFKAKTELDGVADSILEYMTKKNMLNSEFGMMVTAIIRPEIYYNVTWKRGEINYEKQLSDYNTSFMRFLSYAWGIWVTAHARRNLFKAIKALNDDFVYCDTDSVKFLHGHLYADFFDNYNRNIHDKIILRSLELNIPISSFIPTSPLGVKKMIGAFEYEGTYKRFKTLGPKRYMYEYYTQDDNGNYKMGLTNAGVNKTKALAYLREKANYDNSKTFDLFTTGMIIPKSHSGKLTHAYIDEPRSGILTDYLGNTAVYSQLSGLHLEPQEYSADIRDAYINFLNAIGHEEI